MLFDLVTLLSVITAVAAILTLLLIFIRSARGIDRKKLQAYLFLNISKVETMFGLLILGILLLTVGIFLQAIRNVYGILELRVFVSFFSLLGFFVILVTGVLFLQLAKRCK